MQDYDNLASEGTENKFCYLYWEHAHNSQTSLYYLDTPKTIGYTNSAHRTFRPQDPDYDKFIAQLRLVGWQVYKREADQESYRFYLIRPSMLDLDKDYAYCTLSCSVYLDESRPPSEITVFRLGQDNTNLLPLSMMSKKYEEVIEYLAQERWEFAFKEEYLLYPSAPNNRLQLNFYRRPLA